MGYVYASVIDVGTTEDDVFLADSVVLFGIFPTIEPCQVHHFATAVGKMGHHTFLACTHLERFKAEDAALDLHKRHVARQFWDAV